mmetsp:Transcript_10950/g.40794  ORF Transcript_10950/g.40794 Transcript_10950/m.40794 type:complete len:262 (-) Transcript_10950:844-1629(-)
MLHQAVVEVVHSTLAAAIPRNLRQHLRLLMGGQAELLLEVVRQQSLLIQPNHQVVVVPVVDFHLVAEAAVQEPVLKHHLRVDSHLEGGHQVVAVQQEKNVPLLEKMEAAQGSVLTLIHRAVRAVVVDSHLEGETMLLPQQQQINLHQEVLEPFRLEGQTRQNRPPPPPLQEPPQGEPSHSAVAQMHPRTQPHPVLRRAHQVHPAIHSHLEVHRPLTNQQELHQQHPPQAQLEYQPPLQPKMLTQKSILKISSKRMTHSSRL